MKSAKKLCDLVRDRIRGKLNNKKLKTKGMKRARREIAHCLTGALKKVKNTESTQEKDVKN